MNIIEMSGITKKYAGLFANYKISLKIKKGEIHALLGENGAGKTTLVNILFGLVKPDSGTIKINNKKIIINNPLDARKLGIGMVHQHFKLIENFTVLENIILGKEPVKNKILNLKIARKQIVELSEKYKLNINVDDKINDISVGSQQKAEILKMLYRKNEILIFDEPTAVLTPQETEDLMNIIRSLSKEGKTIIFITHKLNEIKATADRCTILKNGKYIGTVDVDFTTKEKLSEMMTGRNINFNIEKKDTNISSNEIILKIENLTYKNKTQAKTLLNNVSFEVRAGEIVCIAGIDGNGQIQLVHAITGMFKPDSGKINLKPEKIAHIPEDRQKFGLVMDYDIGYNMILHNYHDPRFQKFGFLNKNEIYKHAENLMEQFDIRSGKEGVKTLVKNLSGGNQQKLIIARELSRGCNLIAAVQPTRGLDMGACVYIHEQLIKERDKGRGVLVISHDLDEVMDLADRILVMYDGRIVADVKPKDVSYNELGLLMTGEK